jgi:hypothetical protein
MNRWAKCVDNRSSMPIGTLIKSHSHENVQGAPFAISFFLMSSSITKSRSLYSLRRRGSSARYVDTESYRDFGIFHRLFFNGYIAEYSAVIYAGAVCQTNLDTSFFFCSIIDCSRDDIPPHVNISKEAFEDGSVCA